MSSTANGVPQAQEAAPAASPYGGAWEAIIDKATTQVTEYLTASTRAFDPSAALSVHMLHLLDRGTVRDILVERNYNELCGCFGCGNKPRGLLWGLEKGNAGTLSFDWPSSSSSLSSSSSNSRSSSSGSSPSSSRAASVSGSEGEEDDQASGARLAEGKGAVEHDGTSVEKTKKTSHSRRSSARGKSKASHMHGSERSDDRDQGRVAATQEEENEEIVYEDDLYTAESFRLAQRQRAVLNRMERKKLQHEKKKQAAAAAAAVRGTGNANSSDVSRKVLLSAESLFTPRVRSSGMLGATFPQRFCCAECEEMYESGILARVPPYFDYDYPSVFSAVTNLFPNLSVASLQQLAGAEVSASWLVKPIHENNIDTSTTTTKTNTEHVDPSRALKPVQVGVSYESTAHLRRPAAITAGENEKGAAKKTRVSDMATKPAKKTVLFADPSPGEKEEAQTRTSESPPPPLLRSVLEQMHVLQGVWNNEVVTRFSDSHLPRMPAPASTTTTVNHQNNNSNLPSGVTRVTDSAGAAKPSGVVSGDDSSSPQPSSFARLVHVPHPRPVLRGSLLLFDFIMNTSGATTRRLFYLHYTKHRSALLSRLATADSSTPGSVAGRGDGATFFVKVSSSVLHAMEAKYARLNKAKSMLHHHVPPNTTVPAPEAEESKNRSTRHAGSEVAETLGVVNNTQTDAGVVVTEEDYDDEDEDLRIDPVLQQQRRELLTSHLFSEEVAATLSRLLMVDYVLILTTAWSGVWFAELPMYRRVQQQNQQQQQQQSSKEVSSLLRSLLFPYAIPAMLLRAAAASPEVVGLATIYLIAAGCCSAAVWDGCAAADVAFDEVAEVIGLSADDVAAAVHSLMLGEEE